MYTKLFTQISKTDVAEAGGKGASLGEMTQAGIPVPPGFVVLASAFEMFVEETEIKTDIEAVLEEVNHKDTNSVEQASEKIQGIILSEEMPGEIGEEISKEFKKLKSKYVAVRSSATSEDSSSAAWAGQLDTYLNTAEKELLLNVKKCWASLFTPRAIFYRFEKGLHKEFISVAVVVQKMVQSEVSGIAFSVHPVTEDYNQMIIEAGYGLGEAIVSGSITPDSYVVKKKEMEIVDITVADQQQMLVKAKQGNEWVTVPGSKQSKQKLSKAEIMKLSKLIIRIENHYGFPCDIEWAREGGKFYITQSRPITTLARSGEKTISSTTPIVFQKSYSRDTTLFMQGLWARGLTQLSKEKFGWDNPYLPFIAHFMNDGVVEIWEHKKAIEWFLNTLLDENRNGMEFLEKVFKEYVDLLGQLKKLHQKKFLDTRKDIERYTELVYQASLDMTLFFYVGVDKRSPSKAKKLSIQARKLGDFFAENDVFVRNNISRRGKISKELAGVVLSAEFIKIPAKANLEKRLSRYLMIDGSVTYSGSLDTLMKEHGEYVFEKNGALTGKVGEVAGQPAYKGVARGLVRIVRKQSHLEKVKKGDILVAPMTTPDFLPAMDRAAAFVTDEGGVTCHAAIVSREMEKPCVIGTKYATEVLRDGDLVEVDANKGVVRILKK